MEKNLIQMNPSKAHGPQLPPDQAEGPISDREYANQLTSIRLSRGKNNKMGLKCAYRVFVSKMFDGELGNAYIPQKIVRDKLAIFVDQLGQKSVYKVAKNGVVTKKSTAEIISCITWSADRLRKTAPNDEFGHYQLNDFNFGTDDYKKIAQEFIDSAPYIKLSEVASVRQKSDQGFYCFHRVDWDESPGPCPEWESIISRIPDKHQVMQLETWLGALFDPESRIQQALWWHGPGRDGKGSVVRMLTKYFGVSAGVVSSSRGKLGRQAGVTFMNSRFVAMPECNDPKILEDELVKSITGGDPIEVRKLYQEATTEELNTALMICSNKRPEIEWDESLARRLVYVEFEPKQREDQDVHFETRLRKELPALVSRWKQAWTDNQIMGCVPINKAVISTLAAYETDYEYDLIVNKFVVDVTEKMACAEFYLRYEFFSAEKVDGRYRKKLKQILINRFGVLEKVVKSKGLCVRHFVGINARL
jgi:hypothetical protein